MRAEIIDQLKIITEEEQRILEGSGQIDKDIYQAKGESQEHYIIDAERLLEAGKLITLRTHTRFVHFPAHTHNYVEVIYMCKGQTHHVINGEDVLLKEGELLFLNQNSIQEIYPAGEEDIAINFIILPEFFDYALHLMDAKNNLLRDFVLDCMKGENKAANYLHFQVADVFSVQNLVENLIGSLLNPGENTSDINQVTMGLLLLELINCADSIAGDVAEDGNKLMITVLQYADEHYRDGELSQLAELMHYDLYWLSKEIKRQTGQNYTDIVQAKRLSQACYLLKTTDIKVADIATMVGYENVSFFHRLFQKKYGVTPRKYRVGI